VAEFKILTVRERRALLVGCLTCILPALIYVGMMPMASWIPIACFVAVAAAGSVAGGMIATRRKFRGIVSGLLTGLGMFFGILGYVYVRTIWFKSDWYSTIEVVFGAIVGGGPGMWLYGVWARDEV